MHVYAQIYIHILTFTITDGAGAPVIRPVDPGLLVTAKRAVKPVHLINPQPQQRRPTAATVARKRVRFQVSGRPVMVLTLC